MDMQSQPPQPPSNPPPNQANAAVDLGVDDNLSDIEKFEALVTGDIPLQRLVYVKRITDTCQNLAPEDIENRVCPLLNGIADDVEHVIRQALAIELKILIDYLSPDVDEKVDEGSEYGIVVKHCIPTLRKLLSDSIQEVRESACQSILECIHVLSPADLEELVLTPTVDSLKDTASDDDQKAIAIGMLNEMAGQLGQELVETRVGPQLLELSGHHNFRIRKACAQNFGNICKASGIDYLASELLPAFESLSKDNIWSVRKGCIESFVAISEAVGPEQHQKTFIPMIQRFVSDVSRWVRNAAYKSLGPFLYTLNEELITPDLLSLYTDIPTLSNSLVDNDVNYFCAFNFPAVVSRMGPERWNELEGTYMHLCKDTKFKVRRTLSFSLHEVARIVGPDITTESLVPIFELFLKDLDEVRVGVISHLADFLSVLDLESRMNYIDTLRDIQRESDRNWRFRLILAKQIDQFCDIFEIHTVATELVPLLLGLCRDRIAAVRTMSVQKVSNFANCLFVDDKYYPEFLHELHLFATSDTFMERVLYLKICAALLVGIDTEVFKRDFMPHFVNLSRDSVPNVRIIIAGMLSSLLWAPDSPVREERRIQAAVSVLSQDNVDDVKDAFKVLADDLQALNENINEEEAEELLQLVEVYDYGINSGEAKEDEEE